jgi:hypothetical protein
MTRSRFNHSFFGMLLVLIVMTGSLRVRGAISEGPKLTNAAAAKLRQDYQFYQAEQSYQAKLKAGRERYNQKQANRAKIVQAMTAEYQARQQTVVTRRRDEMEAEAALATQEATHMLLILLFGLGLIGFIYYARHEILEAVVALPMRPAPVPNRPVRVVYKVTALQPVSIWASMEESSNGKAAWVELQADEVRDKVAVVFGVHSKHAPNGKRISLGEDQPDIVPLGFWNNSDLPKTFFDAFTIEVSPPSSQLKPAAKTGNIDCLVG